MKVSQLTKRQRPEVLLVIYGDGGHRIEMLRLLLTLKAEAADLKVVSLGVQDLDGHELSHYTAKNIRSKHKTFENLILLPNLFAAALNVGRIIWRYRVTGVISTGAGLCILPMLLLRILGINTIFIETFCRFQSRSFTGLVMSKVAHRFLIQNKELQSLYPHAEYCGRL
jgi:UDP-N-acetylglucosamine:LPS N-acetylglucosamine transferase